MRYARRKNLTPYDVLIIASLIEREAMVAKERPLIASVIYNRLHDGIPLGIDATVRFVTGNWKRPLRQSELANPSPYNTRVHAGLPPGPIGNPGPVLDQGGRAPGQDEVPLLRGQGGQLRRAPVRQDGRRVPGLRERVQPGARGARGQVAHEVLTTLAGVLGFPVGHSRSPAMMNAAFARARARLALPGAAVPPAHFAETVPRAPGSGYRAANVTIPHKLAARELADELSAPRPRPSAR